MRKTTVVFSIVGMIVLSFCAISIKAAQNDFSGVWVLDKGKAHGLPKELKSYTMVVTQNVQQLMVETKVNGGLGAPESKGSMEVMPSRPPGSKGGDGSVGIISGGSGFPAGTLALWLVNPKVTYSLDGKETPAPYEALANVTAKLKAKWAKDGKTLDLSFAQDTGLGGNSAALTIKERWTLSEGGEVLKVQRTVATGQGTDTVVLIFRKGQGKPPTPPQ